MREEINDAMLEEVTGGAIHYSWNKNTQKGSVSSNVTGESYSFGIDKADAVFQYVMSHKNDSDASQMSAIRSIIG